MLGLKAFVVFTTQLLMTLRFAEASQLGYGPGPKVCPEPVTTVISQYPVLCSTYCPENTVISIPHCPAITVTEAPCSISTVVTATTTTVIGEPTAITIEPITIVSAPATYDAGYDTIVFTYTGTNYLSAPLTVTICQPAGAVPGTIIVETPPTEVTPYAHTPDASPIEITPVVYPIPTALPPAYGAA